MSSGDAELTLLRQVRLLRLLTVEAGCAILGAQPTTVIRALGRLTAAGRLTKYRFLHPRCYWAPEPLGAQALIHAASLCYRCTLAEDRLWTPEPREGPATMITSGGELEALFVDYGAEPRGTARKIAAWAAEHDHCALGLIVPSEAKARSINRHLEGIRFVVYPDLWRLQCSKISR